MTGNNLKNWREQRGLSQAVLAKKLGVSSITLSRWEREAQAIPPFLELALKTIGRKHSLKKR